MKRLFWLGEYTMEDQQSIPPWWHPLSHHDRFRKFNTVRKLWFRKNKNKEKRDWPGQTVYLNGAWINDVPSFYLSIGEAINGPYGYFGGDLYGLYDCLTWGIGVKPPQTILLSHFEEVRKALDIKAWIRWHAEIFQDILAEENGDLEVIIDNGYLGDGSKAAIEYWTTVYKAALAGEPFSIDEAFVDPSASYFDGILNTMKDSKVEFLSADIHC